MANDSDDKPAAVLVLLVLEKTDNESVNITSSNSVGYSKNYAKNWDGIFPHKSELEEEPDPETDPKLN